MDRPAERKKDDSTSLSDGTSPGVVESPKIIKLSNTEYYFPSSAVEGKPNSFKTARSQDHADAEDEELILTMPDLTVGSIGDERLTSFKDTETKRVGIQPGGIGESDDDDWEEMLLYVDLDDIPNVDELFAVEPDDFLTFQSKRQREVPKAKKPTLSELPMTFHNLDSSEPILQIGTRYYVGKYEEPMGSSLMFQAKDCNDAQPSSSSSNTRPSSQRLSSIIPDPRPPRDKVYHEKLCSSKYPEYELVANIDKILKMTRKEVRLAGGDSLLLPPTPGGLPPPVPGDSWYTATEIMAGKYHTNSSGPFSSSFDPHGNNSKKHANAKSTRDRSQNKTRPSVSISEESLTADETEGVELELDGTTPELIPQDSLPSGPSILGLAED